VGDDLPAQNLEIARADGTGLTSTSLRVKLKPRATKSYRVRFVAPLCLPAGRYFLAATSLP